MPLCPDHSRRLVTAIRKQHTVLRAWPLGQRVLQPQWLYHGSHILGGLVAFLRLIPMGCHRIPHQWCSRFYFLHLFISVWMCVCGLVNAMVPSWKSEDSLEDSTFSFHHRGPRDQVPATRLGGKPLCQLNHLADPRQLILKKKFPNNFHNIPHFVYPFISG